MRFRGASAGERIAVPLESLVAVYHRPSGETHLLAQPLPEILLALDEGEADVDELLHRLGIAASPKARTALTARLEELAASGLVQAA